MRALFVTLLLSILTWAAAPLAQHIVAPGGGAAFADSGSSDDDNDNDDKDDDDNDDDDDDNSGHGGSGHGGSGHGGPGHGGGGAGGKVSGNGGSQIDPAFGRDGITVEFSDGRVERIRSGQFETLDPRGRVVASGDARRSDRDRLEALGTAARRRSGTQGVHVVVEVGDGGTAVEVTDYRGWREIVADSTYVVKDPNGRTVARRPVTAADIARIRELLRID